MKMDMLASVSWRVKHFVKMAYRELCRGSCKRGEAVGRWEGKRLGAG
jgi:hypothetical protein